jgi:hypothetical protein
MSRPHIEARTRRRIWFITFTVAAWIGCLVAASRLLPGTSGAIAGLIAAVPVVVGVFVLWLYVRWIRNLDELGSKVQLHALAFGFGVLTLATMAYPMVELLGVPPLGIRGYVAIGWSAYFGSLLYSSWRYR